MLIRPFQPADTEALECLCVEDARTRQLAPRVNDPELAPLLFLDEFLQCEPGSCLIAELDDKIAGYVAGTCDVRAHAICQTDYNRRILPRLVAGYARAFASRRLRGRAAYAQALRTVRRLLASRFEDPLSGTQYALSDYPARCHLQVAPWARDRGVGLRLMLAFRKHLKRRSIPGQHSITVEPAGSHGYSDMLLGMGFSLVKTKFLRPPGSDTEWAERLLVGSLQKRAGTPR